MEDELKYKINITDQTLIRLKQYDDAAWHKLMFCVLSESNENLTKEIQILKLKNGDKNESDKL